jgi:hypothetical protein
MNMIQTEIFADIDRPFFAFNRLCVQTYCRGFTRFHYAARHLDDVFVPGFWDDALAEPDMIKPGDYLDISAPEGAVTLYVMPSLEMRVMCATR